MNVSFGGADSFLLLTITDLLPTDGGSGLGALEPWVAESS